MQLFAADNFSRRHFSDAFLRAMTQTHFLFIAASGVKHLYENDIVHRDIKPGNILRFKGEDGR